MKTGRFYVNRPNISAFFDKPLLAAGAGNGHFAFTPGYPDSLAAFGTSEVPVLTVFEPIHQH